MMLQPTGSFPNQLNLIRQLKAVKDDTKRFQRPGLPFHGSIQALFGFGKRELAHFSSIES